MLKPGGRTIVATAVAAAALVLAGCSSQYLDRRETIAMWAGDAQEVNTVTHVVHPMPPHAAHRWLTSDGERVQRAHERYRRGEVIPPATNAGASGGLVAGGS